MAIKLNNCDRYPITADQMMNLMKSREYFESKYRALGALNVTWNTFGEEGGRWVVSSTRTVPANLPAIVRKLIGENSIITQTERWTSDGKGGHVCDFNVTVKGAPGGTTGHMKFVPAGEGHCDWIVDFDIAAPIPFIGKKLESFVAEETKSTIAKECKFTLDWIKSH
ncbi:MAG: DUF2505 domain-containing protein [Myxococcota bacterium]|jgi:hypothetical protein